MDFPQHDDDVDNSNEDNQYFEPITGALPVLWRSWNKRFPAMGRFLERDLSRLLLYCQVNYINIISVMLFSLDLYKLIYCCTVWSQLFKDNFPQLSRLWPAGTTNPRDDIGVRANPRPRMHLRRRPSPRSSCDADAARLGTPRHHGRPR